MEYRYDPHTHTSEVSACGWMDAAHVVDLYHRAGYQGLVVTDHLHESYINSLDSRDDWQRCVDKYISGFKNSLKRGRELDMDIIFGAEIRFPENDRDYLLFGIDEDFLRRNPYLYRMSIQSFFERFSNEILIIQAHPFRNFERLAEPIPVSCLHGLEVINCNPRHDSQNARAKALCDEIPGFIAICGSDTHRPGDEARASMVFNRRLRDSFELKDALEEGKYQLRGCVE